MLIRFRTNGTLYCNTVRYNYKQARNMIADGCYGNISGTQVWANVVASTNPNGYKSYRCFKIATDGTPTQQTLPKLIANHKYYFSVRVFGNGQSLNSAIQIRNSSGTALASLSQWGANYNAWVLQSIIFTTTSDASGGNVSMYGYTNNTYASRLILIDLTDTFGSGKEPSKEWCDNNIREQETLCNFGNVSNNVTYSNLVNRFTGSNVTNMYAYNYLLLDNNREPREYMYGLQASASYTEAYLNSASAFALNNTLTYYAYVEQHTEQVPSVAQSNDFYFPVAEPHMGQIPLVEETGFNGGGGMREWKRVSAFAKRTSFANGSYNSRFDFNNNKQTNVQRLTAFNIMNVASSITQYNKFNGTNITIKDVNKEWCDRWIDGRSSPIIHIKDPNNVKIKFQPLKKVERTNLVASATRASLNSWVGLTNDSWTTNTPNTHLKVGDFAYLDYTISDENNKKARLYVQIVSVEDSVIHTNNLVCYDETQAGYHIPIDIVCNDIEIRPELNKIVFDGTTGTIKCKKLVREQVY